MLQRLSQFLVSRLSQNGIMYDDGMQDAGGETQFCSNDRCRNSIPPHTFTVDYCIIQLMNCTQCIASRVYERLIDGVLLGITEPVAVGQYAKDYLSQAVNPTLLKGLTELCKQKPLYPVVRYRLHEIFGSNLM
jgi:hypothetical protein